MAEEATRRSIDEIIGSIRSIMDRGDQVANDDVPVDLTDLPSGGHSGGHAGGYAEPIVPRGFVDAAPVASPALDHADAARMAQIAETVNRNLPDDARHASAPAPTFAPAPAARAASPARPAPAPVAAPAELDDLDSDAIVASFGRRSAAARPTATLKSDTGRPMHDRFVAIGEVVEEAVTARGVVRAANDAAPTEAPPHMPPHAAAHSAAPAPAASLPATLPAPVHPSMQPSVQAPFADAHAHANGAGADVDPLLNDATLRPIIREWLDDNLPPLVEKLVREELQKAIHGGRRGR